MKTILLIVFAIVSLASAALVAQALPLNAAGQFGGFILLFLIGFAAAKKISESD